MLWVAFGVGLFIGACLGVLAIGLCAAARAGYMPDIPDVEPRIDPEKELAAIDAKERLGIFSHKDAVSHRIRVKFSGDRLWPT